MLFHQCFVVDQKYRFDTSSSMWWYQRVWGDRTPNYASRHVEYARLVIERRWMEYWYIIFYVHWWPIGLAFLWLLNPLEVSVILRVCALLSLNGGGRFPFCINARHSDKQDIASRIHIYRSMKHTRLGWSKTKPFYSDGSNQRRYCMLLHPSKGLGSTFNTKETMRQHCKLPHPQKAVSSIVVTEAGKPMDFKLLQPSKA